MKLDSRSTVNRSSIRFSRRSRSRSLKSANGQLRAARPGPQVGHLGRSRTISAATWKTRSGNNSPCRILIPELTLQTEHDVQEVDGLRAQIALQGRGGLDVVFLYAQRVARALSLPSRWISFEASMVWSLLDKLRLTNNGDGFTSAPSHRTTYSGSSRAATTTAATATGPHASKLRRVPDSASARAFVASTRMSSSTRRVLISPIAAKASCLT